MEGNSFLLALLCAIPHIINIILLKRKFNKNKKDISHYEAISDKHSMKLYNPIHSQVYIIIIIVFVSFFVSYRYFIVLYFLICLLDNIMIRLACLQNNIDLLSIRNGLITTYPVELNPYSIADDVIVECSDDYNWDGKLSNSRKRLFYKLNEQVLYSHTIRTDNLSNDEIKDHIYWFEKRFKDYCRYIPESVFKQEHTQETIDYWFTYLDDIRSNY